MEQLKKAIFFVSKKISTWSFGFGTFVIFFAAAACNSDSPPAVAKASIDSASIAPPIEPIKFSRLRLRADNFVKYYEKPRFRKFVFQIGTHDQNAATKTMGLYCYSVGKDVGSGPRHVLLDSFWLEADPATAPVAFANDGIYSDMDLHIKTINNRLGCVKKDIAHYLFFTPVQLPNFQISYVITVEAGTDNCGMPFLPPPLPLNPSPPAKPGLTSF
jgi:hypothetical protein